MKALVLSALILAGNVIAADYYLKPEDQKFFKNDGQEGKNQYERIDANVKEINKIHSEMIQMKTELATLRREVDELKKK